MSCLQARLHECLAACSAAAPNTREMPKCCLAYSLLCQKNLPIMGCEHSTFMS